MIKTDAQKEARGIASRLGPGWKPRVWHNESTAFVKSGGVPSVWYARAVSICGRIRVSTLGKQQYVAYIGTRGDPAIEWSGVAKTPGEAVMTAYQTAAKDLKRKNALIAKFPAVKVK